MSDSFDRNKTDKSLSNTGVYNFEDRYKETKYNDEIAGILKTANYEAERKRQIALAKQKARKKKIYTRLSIVMIALILVLTLLISGIVGIVRGIASLAGGNKEAPDIAQLISSADLAAASYDYDKAMEIIRSYGEKYDKKKELKAAILKYEDGKASLIKYTDNSQIPHLSFRTLIYDTSKAFDGDDSTDKYDRNMVTVSEFSSILDTLYSRGYVLVGPDDIARNNNGTPEFCDIYLPSNKKPIMISQENVSYYRSLAGNGFASKLVLNDQKNPVCEYKLEDGSVSMGAYDLVPILESFLKKYPDFSYRGARATLAVTGYDGVLGYRTNPNGNGYQPEDAERAKTVVNRLKELGYTFAANSWDYTSYGNNGTDHVKKDADRWEKEVKPIVGDTSVFIFAGDADIANDGKYQDNNEKLNHLKAKGFFFFCPAESTHTAITIGDGFLRQGRQNISGNTLYHNAEKLTDYFDVERILDIARPNASNAETE